MKQSPVPRHWTADPQAAVAIIEAIINYFENLRLSQQIKYKKSALGTLIFELHHRKASNQHFMTWWAEYADIGALLSCIDDYLADLGRLSCSPGKLKPRERIAECALKNALQPHAAHWESKLSRFLANKH